MKREPGGTRNRKSKSARSTHSRPETTATNSKYRRAFDKAYNHGYNDGFVKGFEDGHQSAYDEPV